MFNDRFRGIPTVDILTQAKNSVLGRDISQEELTLLNVALKDLAFHIEQGGTRSKRKQDERVKDVTISTLTYLINELKKI